MVGRHRAGHPPGVGECQCRTSHRPYGYQESPDEKGKRDAALRAREAIEKFRPDVVIASDDNAVKYLVVPYLKNTTLPVVFCGVNWEAALYGLPDGNVTGMVEVDLVETQIMHLSRYAGGTRIGYLSGDTETERKIIDIYNKRFFNGRLKSYLVTTFADFQKQFLRKQYGHQRKSLSG